MRDASRLRFMMATAVLATAVLLGACASTSGPTSAGPPQDGPVSATAPVPDISATAGTGARRGPPVTGEAGKMLSAGGGVLTSGAVPEDGSASSTAQPAQAERRQGAPAAGSGGDAGEAKPRIYKGSDTVLAPPRAAPPGQPAAKDVSFKFEQAPVREVVHAVLGELLGFTYVLHQSIGGTVTVSTAAPLPADQALSVLESVLQANGLLMAQDDGGVFHVGPPDALRGIVPVTKRIGQALPPGYGAAIVPLKFVGAAEMAEILRPIARPEAVLRVDNLRNLLILAGSRNQIEGWLEIVRIFDVDLLKGMSVGVFPLQYASVLDIDSALRSLVAAGDGAPVPAPATGAAAQARPQAQAAATAAAALPRHPLLGALRVIPLEKMNSLLVITPRAAYLDEIKLWIDRLDRPSGTDIEPRLFVYPVQNGSASHLANVLNGLYGTGTGTAGGADSGVAPGLRSATGATATGSRLGTTTQAMPAFGTRAGAATALGAGALPQTGTRAAGTTGVASAALAAGMRIVGDDLNNAVLFYGPAAEFRKIEETLKRLDAPVTQVLIEATIIEVTLRDELQYGLQWYFTDTARGGLAGRGTLNTNASGPIGAQQPGFSYTLTDSLAQVRVALNMLADRSLIRVISSPSLMVVDNHTAMITVGDQQPIRTSETVTVGGNVTTAIEYKDTGVLLSVTPSVNSADMVAMTINQSVTDVGPIDVATGQRAFLQRQIGSRVAVRSGEALVLGGLIRDNSTKGSTGIPLLSRIPVLGALFGTQTQDGSRTELLVVITPRVVRSAYDAKEIGVEMRDRMRGFRALVEESSPLLPKPLVEQVAPPRPPAEPPAAAPGNGKP